MWLGGEIGKSRLCGKSRLHPPRGTSGGGPTSKHEKLLRVFLTAIGSKNAHQLVHVRNAEYTTMLHTAVMINNLECVKLLLEYGADLSAKNLSGQTPLLVLNIGLSLVGSAP